MDTIEIQKSNVQAAFKAAGENPEIQVCLRHLFGDIVEPEQAQDNRHVTERIKTFEDAMAALDSNHPFVCDFRAFCAQSDDISSDDISPDMLAYLKLRIICAALNEGWEPEFTEEETRYYPWFWLYTQEELDNIQDSEKKARRMIDTGDYQTEFAGFGYARSTNAPSDADAGIGSRLCLHSSELAIHCGKQFIKLWADYNLVRK